MTLAIRIQPKARADLAGIWRYTESEWGIDRADSYVEALLAAIRRAADNPAIAPAYQGRRQVYRKLGIRSHLIFYRFDDSHIYVVRILHQNMDIARKL